MNKIEISIGDIKVSYEGDKEYIRDDLPKLLDKLLLVAKTTLHTDDTSDIPKENKAATQKTINHGTTNAIAKQLDVKSGPDLFYAAAAKFHFVDNKQRFLRKELLTEIRTAPQYYKPSYSGNASKCLSGLLADKFNEVAKHTYALKSNAVTDLEQRLAT